MTELLKDYPEIMNVSTVAKILHVTPKTIRKHVEKEEIPAIKIGKIYRIPKEWLLSYLNNGKEASE